MEIGSEDWDRLLASGGAELGVGIEERHLRRFAVYARLLLVWNRKINLTRIETPRDIAIKHFLDSLSVLPWVANARALVDVGTGAGFPGIPLKILLPDLEVRLVDTSRKRINFLREVVRTLELPGVFCHHGPARALADDAEFRRRFDAVVSRAFVSVGDLYDIGAPLLRKGGVLIAMKGKGVDAELEHFRRRAAAEGLPGRIASTDVTLPFSPFERRIVCMTL
jgi:16S rRNA (guanine527-N7)-methyltransferase